MISDDSAISLRIINRVVRIGRIVEYIIGFPIHESS